MRGKSKEKLDVQPEMPLQLILEDSVAEHVIIAADNGIQNVPLERRKEEAGKPLYLKRV